VADRMLTEEQIIPQLQKTKLLTADMPMVANIIIIWLQ